MYKIIRKVDQGQVVFQCIAGVFPLVLPQKVSKIFCSRRKGMT